MGKIIAIANQKGGVGTTTTINLGAALSSFNQKVLVIDLDPQANATIGLGLKREMINYTSYFVLTTNLTIKEAIQKQLMMDIVPASIELENIGEKLYDTKEKEQILSHKLEAVKEDYDFILLDCPPSSGILIDNALFASDSVLIPVECEYFAYDALTQMVNKIYQVQTIKKTLKQSLIIEGVLLTKLDNRNVFGYRIVEKVKELYPDKTFQTIISRSSHLQEAPMHGKSVLEFAYNSRGSKQYRDLAKELLDNNRKEKE